MARQQLFVNAAPYEPSYGQLGSPAGGLGQQNRGGVFPYDQQQQLGQQQLGAQQVYYQQPPQQAQYGGHIQQGQLPPGVMPGAHQPGPHQVLSSPHHGGGQQILYQNAGPAPAPAPAAQYVYDYQGNLVPAAGPGAGGQQPGQQIHQQILLSQGGPPHGGHPHAPQPQYISIVPLPGGGTAQVASAPPPTTYAYVQYDAAGNVTAVPQPQQTTFVMGPNGVPIAV